MAEYQKFTFSENYSKSPENLEAIKQKQLLTAKKLLSDEMETAKQQAFENGFQEGQKMALEKLKNEMDGHINTIIESITKINEYKPEIHNIFEQYATSCVKHLVENLYFKADEIIPDKILKQSIENALKNLPMVSQIAIYLPQNALTYIADTNIETKIREKGISDFCFKEDPELASGECRIQWDNSGLLSSKKESFKIINDSLSAFLSGESIELAEKAKSEIIKDKDSSVEISNNPVETDQTNQTIEKEEENTPVQEKSDSI